MQRQDQLEYWNNDDVESMYDKHLLSAEIDLIRKYIPPGARILDAGCGEGEGTLMYSSIPDVTIHAVDFSDTRLRKASERLNGLKNVTVKKVDFLESYELDSDYNIVISQRFLINLIEWRLQQKVLLDLMRLLTPGGRLLMLEGSRQGVDSLNEFRSALGLDVITIKWHNLFFDDQTMIHFMKQHGYQLIGEEGLGAYFLLTRGIRPALDQTLNWDSDFNRLAADSRIEDLLRLGSRFSRLKLWVFQN